MPPWLAARLNAHRSLRIAAWTLATLALLALLAWLALPPLLRSLAQDRLSQTLGRPVTLAAVHINPLTLTLQVDGLAIGAAAPGAPPTLEVAQLRVDADLRSLLRLAPVVEELRIEAPHLRLARLADGRYDIDDVLQRLRSPQTAPPADDKPARFALYNLSLVNGTVEFDDRPVSRMHQLQSLTLGVPFLSNLDETAIAVKVEPRLAFTLGGTRFDTGAQTTPFARDRAGLLTLRTGEIDLAAWLPYLPASVPLRPTRGHLLVDLGVQFTAPPGAPPQVVVKGQVKLRDFALADRNGATLAELPSLSVALADVQPLRRQVRLGAVELDGLRIDAQRDEQGRLNLLQAVQGVGGKATAAAQPPVKLAVAAASSAASGASSLAATETPAPTAWQLAVERLTLRDTALQWQDRAVQPAARLALQLPQLQLDTLSWPLREGAAPARLSADARIGVLQAADSSGDLHLEGQLGAAGGQLDAKAERWLLSLFAPYIAQSLKPQVDGQLSLVARAEWQGLPGAQAPLLTLPSLTLDNLRVAESRKPGTPALASLRSLTLKDLRLDTAQRRVGLAQLQLTQPVVEVRRGADGAFNLQQWLVSQGDAAGAAPTSPPAASTPEPAPWKLAVQDTSVSGGAVRWRDAAAGSEPVALDVAALRLAVKGVQWPAEAKSPWRVQGSAQLTAPSAERASDRSALGKLAWDGQLGLTPVAWRGSATVERFPVHAVAAYLGDALPVAILRAEAGWRGDIAATLAPAGLSLDVKGDARLTDLRVNARHTGEQTADYTTDDLLSWQSLALNGVTLALQPGAKPTVAIENAVLSDFFAKLLVTEQGRLNLTDLAPPPAVAASAPEASTEGAAPAAAVALSAPASPSAPVPVTAASDALAAGSASTAVSGATVSGTAAASGLPIDLRLGGVKLQNGRVDFTDRFVRPNYSAALSELNGQLGAFRSGSTDMATLALTGRVAGTALLDVSGSLNPTAHPLALDIHARATDLELAPLSPYAAKYAGYAIERGKLSMDVSYKIQPDGQLQAKNQVVLNQLTFGERVESPTATKLPVLLAVSLLKDRNGVIDLDLPIGGSINDPQFSVGGLIVKVIVNLLTKALFSPFALLSGGGDTDLSLVEFVPGTAQPAPASQAVMDKVAKALEERPALKMTVTGASDPQSERDAMQAAQLEARLQAERRQERLRAGEPAGATAPTLSADERVRLLKKVYGDTRLSDKPRNLVGLAKDVPPAEMEARLKASFPVTTDTARELALQRGLAVRDALIAKGLANERLFLAAPKLRASTDDDAHWTPRVQLSLGTQ